MVDKMLAVYSPKVRELNVTLGKPQGELRKRRHRFRLSGKLCHDAHAVAGSPPSRESR